MSQYDYVINHAKRDDKVREIHRHCCIEFGLRAYSIPSIYRIVREFRCSNSKPKEESTRGRPIDTQLVRAVRGVLKNEPTHISKEKLISVYQNWMKRCERIIELKGNYFDKD